MDSKLNRLVNHGEETLTTASVSRFDHHHSPWPSVSLSPAVSMSTNRLMWALFSLQAFAFFLVFTVSAVPPLVFQFLSCHPKAAFHGARCLGFMLMLWFVSLCQHLGVCPNFCMFVVCVYPIGIHLCVFPYLPRLGIKCQSCRLMFSLIERHSRNESIAEHRFRKKKDPLKSKTWNSSESLVNVLYSVGGVLAVDSPYSA